MNLRVAFSNALRVCNPTGYASRLRLIWPVDGGMFTNRVGGRLLALGRTRFRRGRELLSIKEERRDIAISGAIANMLKSSGGLGMRIDMMDNLYKNIQKR